MPPWKSLQVHKMYLYGASGHGKVVWNILHDLGIKVKGFIDDNTQLNEFMELPVYPSTEYPEDCKEIIIAIGSNQLRFKITKLLPKGIQFPIAIHPRSYTGYDVTIGKGTVIMPNTALQIGTIVGKHCIINTSSSIDHECIIGDYVHISPNATLSGQVKIGNMTWVGLGAVIKQCVSIGENSIIGAGAVVLEDIPDNCTAVGIPAKVIKSTILK